MDQDTVVNLNLEGGWHLIRALWGHGFDVTAAFWVKMIGEERWLLFIASPEVDAKGLGPSYHLIHSILRDAPEWGIDPFEVMAVGTGEPMSKAAAELVKPKAGPFAAPKPYLGVTRFSGRSLGGIPIEGAIIYPPWQPGVTIGAP